MELNKCIICNNNISKKQLLAHHLCLKCSNQFNPIYKTFLLDSINVLVLYEYKQFFRELLLKFKGYYDIKLAPVFLAKCLSYLKLKYRNYIIVPAPSTTSSNKKRGFLHLNEIFKYLGLPIINCFNKDKNIKQSDQGKFLRHNINKIISLNASKINKNCQYLIVDDVITTGSTISSCIHLLKKCNVKKIAVLILSKKLKM